MGSPAGMECLVPTDPSGNPSPSHSAAFFSLNSSSGRAVLTSSESLCFIFGGWRRAAGLCRLFPGILAASRHPKHGSQARAGGGSVSAEPGCSCWQREHPQAATGAPDIFIYPEIKQISPARLQRFLSQLFPEEAVENPPLLFQEFDVGVFLCSGIGDDVDLWFSCSCKG